MKTRGPGTANLPSEASFLFGAVICTLLAESYRLKYTQKNYAPTLALLLHFIYK